MSRLCSASVSAWLPAILMTFSLCPAGSLQAQQLPGTRPLEMEGDIALSLVAGVDKFLLSETEKSLIARAVRWKRDSSSAEAYEKSVEPNRQRLRKILGVVDSRENFTAPSLVGTTYESPMVGRGDGYEVLAVRWPVLPGVSAEGLLVRPVRREALADIVAIPDADQLPELLAGLTPGLPPTGQWVRRLGESGFRVLVPVLIDRQDTHSFVHGGRPTNQPNREFLYRGAFEMGRTLIGLEVQKVLAAVDWFERDAALKGKKKRIGVMGYGEGGLLALYAGALDPRIDVTLVSGYFDSRQNLWQEPIYRNVWSLLTEFGDAELASLIAPRTLIVEASAVPQVSGPPAPREGRAGAAPGRLETPELKVVEHELARAKGLSGGLKPPQRLELIATQSKADAAPDVPPDGQGAAGSEAALVALVDALVEGTKLVANGEEPARLWREKPDFAPRQARQFAELNEHIQSLMRASEFAREKFWAKADRTSVATWEKSCIPYRDYFDREVIGRIDQARLPLSPRSRKVYDEPKYVGYEVVLDVFPEVIAYGILLVPKGILEGERRPVVVCQHGLEGRPQDLADPKVRNKAYNQVACRLAEEGFITYAPQNLYLFKDQFRTLQRKANPLKKSLFSVIVPQHQAATDWLAGLPMVDPEKIAFYGLSYGGKTAMRVPPLVSRYCLSICSADFNEWIWKNASNRHKYSYLGTGEYEMAEFDLANTFNYAEMAGLIAPRPFMVERGHHDGVAPDEWVAYEFARVKRLYVALKIPNQTTIEFFDGPHSIHGVGTFDFLREKLAWPRKR